MEYPMMVNDDSYAHLGESFKVTAHEILHSYFPFMTGCNERKYAWMDEGLTSFFDVNMMRDLAVEGMDYPYFIDEYVDLQGTERDIPLITISELIRQPEYFGLSYAKAVSFYTVLMDELGREEFRELIREFADQWKGKHPTGYDLLNTFEHKTGQDLWWLIEPWFFETGSCDLAISDARISDTGYAIDIKRIGNLPTSVRLSITYKDGSQEVITEKPSVWSNEKDVYTLSIPSGKPIKQLELLPIIPMDSNRQNDTWTF
jgi:aminopeptidase N